MNGVSDRLSYPITFWIRVNTLLLLLYPIKPMFKTKLDAGLRNGYNK